VEKGILRDILRLAVAAKNTVRQRVDAWRMPVEQGGKGVTVTALRARNKPGVDGRGVVVFERVKVRVRRREHMVGHTHPSGGCRSAGGEADAPSICARIGATQN